MIVTTQMVVMMTTTMTTTMMMTMMMMMMMMTTTTTTTMMMVMMMMMSSFVVLVVHLVSAGHPVRRVQHDHPRYDQLHLLSARRSRGTSRGPRGDRRRRNNPPSWPDGLSARLDSGPTPLRGLLRHIRPLGCLRRHLADAV